MEEKIFNHFQKMIEATMVTMVKLILKLWPVLPKKLPLPCWREILFSPLGKNLGCYLPSCFSDYLALGYDIDRPGFPSINLNQITQNSSDNGTLRSGTKYPRQEVVTF